MYMAVPMLIVVTKDLIFRAKRNMAMLCLKGSDYNSSSIPVKYIPKTSSKVNEPEDSSCIRGSEKAQFDRDLSAVARTFNLDKKPQDGSPTCLGTLSIDDRRRVKKGVQDVTEVATLEKEINPELQVMNNGIMGEPKETIKEMKIQKLSGRASKTRQDAEMLAVELLASRAFTAVELRKKLCGKGYPSHIVEAVTSDFQSRGLINDSLYAETFSRSRWSTRSWGPKRIKQALHNKGISEADMEKAIKLVFEDEFGDDESIFGLSKHSMDHLLVQASKQWLRGQDVPNETRKSRIIRWLQYRGFNWGVISFVLKKLESQHPP
uniref:Regulatory protein RecX n=3 Tax=Rhizophora mucronata TaxID=61149 RepID=A0A2P2KDS9_RHIMU